jgi:hypothetical protein
MIISSNVPCSRHAIAEKLFELTPTNPVTLKPQSYKLPTQVITFLDFHFMEMFGKVNFLMI